MLNTYRILTILTLFISCDGLYDYLKGTIHSYNHSWADILKETHVYRNEIQRINATHININSIDARTLPFPNLVDLTIIRSPIQISPKALSHMKQLKQVDFSENNITNFNTQLFAGLKIEEVNYSSNYIRKLGKVLYNLNSVKLLNFSYNLIVYLSPTTFSETPNLKYLDLRGNTILHMHYITFKKLRYLSYINLSDNMLKGNILQNVFDENKLISKMYIANNPLVTIPNNIFFYSENLSVLDIINCSITKQDVLINVLMNDLANVTMLFLSHNKVNFLFEEIFQNMRKLKRLELSSMRLNYLNKDTFESLTELEILNLSHNEITHLHPDIFINNFKLSQLDLDHNKLNFYDGVNFLKTNLRSLNLSHNRITKIAGDLFHMRTFQSLLLGHNNIKHLETPLFSKSYLRVLDLTHNCLVHVNFRFFDWATELQTFEFVGNPWMCECFDEMLRVMADRKIVFNQREGYFSGEKPVCVAANTNVCAVNETLHSESCIILGRWRCLN